MRFLLVDRILSLEPGRSATGIKTIAPDEEYFRDHFPGYAVVPGVLLLESMAQLGGRLVEATVREGSRVEVLPVLGLVKEARFHRPVKPGDRVDLSAEMVSLRESAARVTGAARVAGQLVAAAELTFVLLKLDDRAAGLGQQDIDRLRAWSRDVWHAIWRG